MARKLVGHNFRYVRLFIDKYHNWQGLKLENRLKLVPVKIIGLALIFVASCEEELSWNKVELYNEEDMAWFYYDFSCDVFVRCCTIKNKIGEENNNYKVVGSSCPAPRELMKQTY